MNRIEYPLRENKGDRIFTPGGVNINDICFENVEKGIVDKNDCRVSKETLMMQAEIAESVGNLHVAENFRRASEMTLMDSDRLIEIYNMLRPYRSTKEELMATVLSLREEDAIRLADFVEEACEVLAEMKKLRGDR